jgi:hypothetical protein
MQKPGGFPRRAECKYIPSDLKNDDNRVVLALPVIPDIMLCARSRTSWMKRGRPTAASPL